MDAKSWASRPTDRKSRPTEARRSGSSSMTKTVGFASGIPAAQGKMIRETALVFNCRFDVAVCTLVPMCSRGQRYGTRKGQTKSISLVWRYLGAQLVEFENQHKLKFTARSYCSRSSL